MNLNLRDYVLELCAVLFGTILFGVGCDTSSSVSTRIVRNFDGTLFKIVEVVDQPRRYGHPDIMQIGGRRVAEHVICPVTEPKAKWVGSVRPIAIHHDDRQYYLVALDADNPGKAVFRFYTFATNWTEIGAGVFPKRMGIQNLSLSTNAGCDRAGMPIDEVRLISEMNVTNDYFRLSLTARLWEGLETAKPYYEISGRPVGVELLQSYKEKFIRVPRAGP
jgi:hypothetical protein